jgi:hypothetical protein
MRVFVRIEMRQPDSSVEDAPHLRGQLIVDADAPHGDRSQKLRDAGGQSGIRRGHLPAADQHQVSAGI